MRHLILTITLLVLLVVPATAYASHGMWEGSSECGERVFVADLTKGRTDSLVFHARHTAGCFTYDYTNYAPAGIGEFQGNAWQKAECARMAAYDMAVLHFDYYRHVKVDPADIKYTCEPWKGSD